MYSMLMFSMSEFYMIKLHSKFMTIRLSFNFLEKSIMFEVVKNPPEEWWHSTGGQEDMEVPDWGWGPWSCLGCVSLMTISLCFKFDKNLTYLSWDIAWNRSAWGFNDILLEFRITWMFLTGTGVFDHILNVFLWWQ